MPSETEIIIAFLFNRGGKPKLGFSDLYLTLSMDLNWFTPDDAKSFINSALKQKILTKKGDLYEPNFDYDKITVPVGFTPSKRVLEEKVVKKEESAPTILDKIVKQIVEKSDLNNKQIFERINLTAKEKNITTEVAALLIAKEFDVELEDFFEKVEKSIFT